MYDTRVVERGRVKCGQYWPADEEGIEQYGSFAVINSGVEVDDHYSVTSLLLQNLEVCRVLQRFFLVESWSFSDVIVIFFSSGLPCSLKSVAM